MSTKIYNAFKFNGTPEQLMVILKDIKKEYTEQCKNDLSKLKLDEIEFNKKRYPFLEKDMYLKESDFPDFTLSNIIERETIIGERSPLNIDASAVVYFHDGIFVQFFGLPDSIINKHPMFEDYHYQNQSDMSNYDEDKEPIESMTEERLQELNMDWIERRDTWDEILPWSDPVPSNNGLIFSFIPNHYELSMFCRDLKCVHDIIEKKYQEKFK